MIFMLTAWYPYPKTKEVVKKTISAPQLPDYIKKWQSFGTPDGNNGMKVYNLIMVEKDKTDEALIFISKLQSEFTDIDGYVWKIEPCMGVQDALKVLEKD
ncbi:MAG: hypothetical protein ACXACG_05260 [Candidatus Thorarchaeota archaeon]